MEVTIVGLVGLGMLSANRPPFFLRVVGKDL